MNFEETRKLEALGSRNGSADFNGMAFLKRRCAADFTTHHPLNTPTKNTMNKLNDSELLAIYNRDLTTSRIEDLRAIQDEVLRRNTEDEQIDYISTAEDRANSQNRIVDNCEDLESVPCHIEWWTPLRLPPDPMPESWSAVDKAWKRCNKPIENTYQAFKAGYEAAKVGGAK